MTMEKKLGWQAESLLSELLDRKSVSDAMIRHNKEGNALRSLISRGYASPETYANGLHWLPTDKASDYQFS